jgi:hypothetical protein
MAMPEEHGNKLMIPLISLIAVLRDLGVEVNPSNVFAEMFVALRTQPERSRG